MKPVELRHQASQGNLGAVAALLTQALSHKGVSVAARAEDCTLVVTLRANPLPDAATCLILLGRELLTWPPIVWQLLRVEAKSPSSDILWGQQFDLTNPATLPGLAQVRLITPPTAKYSPVIVAPPPVELIIPVQEMDTQAWQSVGIGAGLALALVLFAPLTFLFSPLITLIHELGHAVTAWLFGYPAIPAFDFLYGGGVTLHGDRWPILLWLIYGGLAGGAWWYRRNRLTLMVLGGFTVIYSWFALSGMHQALFVAMGHGFELIFAGIFLYRALSGFGCRYSFERPLYGMLGFFIVFYDLRFAWRLIFDPVEQAIYREGKGGILDHDFVRLSQEYVHLDLAITVGLFWWLVLLLPVAIYFIYRYRQLMRFGFARLFLWRSDQNLESDAPLL